MSAIRRMVTVFLVSSALTACQEDTSGDSDGSVPDLLAEQRAACEKQGGRYGMTANGVTFTCFRPMSDANQPCATERDCDGLCLARSRTCSPIEPFYGCHEVLSSSGIRQTLCIE